MTQFEDLEVEKGKATVSLAASEAAAATTTTTKEDHDVVGDEAEEGRSREESQRGGFGEAVRTSRQSWHG